MDKSENIDELAKALGQFQADMPKLSRSREVKVKTKSGGSYGFKYTPLEQILEEVLPRLQDYGLSISQFPASNAGVTTFLLHESGQFISETSTFDIKTNNPQDLGGVITYLRRYALGGVLGIITDEDDDANSASGNTITKQTDKKQKPRKKKTPKTKTINGDFDNELNSLETTDAVVEWFNKTKESLEGPNKEAFTEEYTQKVNKKIQEIS